MVIKEDYGYTKAGFGEEKEKITRRGKNIINTHRYAEVSTPRTAVVFDHV